MTTVSARPVFERSFEEDFYIAVDGPTLALDFWSYLNALQARLGWTREDDRMWDYIEEMERDLVPLLEALPGEAPLPFLLRVLEEWRPGTPDGERDAVRGGVAAMLRHALDAQADLAHPTTTPATDEE
jgi:hypothetical protein